MLSPTVAMVKVLTAPTRSVMANATVPVTAAKSAAAVVPCVTVQVAVVAVVKAARLRVTLYVPLAPSAMVADPVTVSVRRSFMLTMLVDAVAGLTVTLPPPVGLLTVTVKVSGVAPSSLPSRSMGMTTVVVVCPAATVALRAGAV